MTRARRSLLAIALATLACACEQKAPQEKGPAYGEPVGMQMSPGAGLPAFELAVAVSKGADVTPLAAPLSGLLHGAIKACPGFVRASAGGGVTQVAFSAGGGKVRSVTATGDHPDPCLASNIDGKPLALPQGGPPSELDVLVQIRFAKPADDPEAP